MTQLTHAAAQEKYARDTECPLFAPTNGRCYNCRKNIYEKISLEEAGSRLITRCPYCSTSFCA